MLARSVTASSLSTLATTSSRRSTIADPRMVSSVAQRVDAPLVHIGLGQVEAGDLMYITQRTCDRFSLAPRCLPSVDEWEQP